MESEMYEYSIRTKERKKVIKKRKRFQLTERKITGEIKGKIRKEEPDSFRNDIIHSCNT